MSRETILAADIGGTNTRLLLYEVIIDDIQSSVHIPQGKEAPGTLLLQKRYQNQDFEQFIDVLKKFLREAYIPRPPLSACFAVAGPVKDNVVRFTNRAEWIIDGYSIAEQVGIKSVKLINDFVANGYGLLTLNEETECVTLQKAEKNPTAPIACIGAGTGLGECFLTPLGNGEYQCYPSEGGHAEFAPRNELEIGLLTFLKEKFNQKHRVSVERVVSGTGLVNIYEYLCQIYPDRMDPVIHQEIDSAGDLKGAIIAKYSSINELCKKTFEIFVTSYGSEAGVAGLKWLPFGGLYLTGGLTPKNIDLLKDPDGPFLAAFMDKGRVSGMLCSIPVYAVKTENLGQRGSHLVAYQDLVSIIAERNLHSSKLSEKGKNKDSGSNPTSSSSSSSSSTTTHLKLKESPSRKEISSKKEKGSTDSVVKIPLSTSLPSNASTDDFTIKPTLPEPICYVLTFGAGVVLTVLLNRFLKRS